MDSSFTVVLAHLAWAAYEVDGNLPEGMPAGWSRFDCFKEPLCGFTSFAYEEAQTGRVVVAFRGTDPGPAGLADWLFANPATVGGFTPVDWGTQFTLALEFVDRVLDARPSARVSVTGHSLGGALAQVASHFYDLNGVAFDPPGAENILNSAYYRLVTSNANIFDGRYSRPPNNHVPEFFTNFLVEGSVVSGFLTGANFPRGTDFRISADWKSVAEAYTDALERTFLRDVLDIVWRGAFELRVEIALTLAVHKMDGIVRTIQALEKADRLPPWPGEVAAPIQVSFHEFADDYVRGNLPALTSGDVVVNPTLGIEDTPARFAGAHTDILEGNNGVNELHGGGGADTLMGYGGNDVLHGDDGDDILVGGAGDDMLYPGAGTDTVLGGSGNDIIVSAAGFYGQVEIIDGGEGTDRAEVDLTALNGPLEYEITQQGGKASVLRFDSTLASINDALAGIQSIALVVPARQHRTELTYVEHVSTLTAGGSSLVLHLGGQSARASGPNNTFYADWSGVMSAIVWDNRDPAVTHTVAGVQVSGMQRLLLQTGTGNDTLSASVGDDELRTGPGGDVIDAGPGSDVVDAGPGDDRITVKGFVGDRDNVDGGVGKDLLVLDYAAVNGPTQYEVWSGSTMRLLQSASSLEEVRLAFTAADSLLIRVGPDVGPRTRLVNIEQVNISASTGLSLTVFLDGNRYIAPVSSGDTFYADWHSRIEPTVWMNSPSASHFLHGIEIRGMDRLLLLTGEGDDVIANLAVLADDEMLSGGGNDWLRGGPGNDRLDGGPGKDILDGGTGADALEGGLGLDTARFDGPKNEYRLVRDADEQWLVVGHAPPETDTLRGVERIEFADVAVALDFAGEAGYAARAIGAFFGRSGLVDRKLAGLALSALDQGMSYEGLVAYAASTAFATTLTGSGSDESLIRLLYRNVVGVEASAGDVAVFASLLVEGRFTRATLAMFAAESVLNATNINLTGLAQTGWEYLPAD